MSADNKPFFHIDKTNLTDIYSVTLGYNGDKYMCTGVGNGFAEFRRVRMAKSKIDGVRLPERISLSFFGSSVTKKSKTKKP